MSKFAVIGLVLGLLIAPLQAQEATPHDSPSLRQQAIKMMGNTPLLTYDKRQAMIIAEMSYECAGYLDAMQQLVNHMAESGKLPADIPRDAFIEGATTLEMVHVGLAEIIHLIYEVEEVDSLNIRQEQYQKAYDALNDLSPEELKDKYDLVCKGILNTYLP